MRYGLLISISLAFIHRLAFACAAMLLCDEEIQILAFLKTSPENYFGAGEICRKAGTKKLLAKNPRWALPYLVTLRDKELLEADPQGHYRIKPERTGPLGSDK